MNPDLLGKLRAGGALTEDWVASFLAVPRREFLPETLWVLEDRDRMYHPVTRHEQPVRWCELADGDKFLITQVDDGHPVGPGGVGDLPTSSSSEPYMVASMLRHLDVRGGERVLEIGTGTGWNAALLAQRLGSGQITTVEIDSELAERAREALASAGFGDVTVIVGNGSAGSSSTAPFDRVISTASCHTVPYAWVRQCNAGGRIVTPWGTEFSNWALIALDVHEDRTASGSVVGAAAFMRMRDQRIPFHPVDPTEEEEAAATVRTTSLTPADVMRHSSVLITMAARVQDCQARYRAPSGDPDGEALLFLADRHTGAWARLHADPDSSGPHKVVQGGRRQLFDEVEAAYQWWTEQGCPRADEWLITVDEHDQRITLT